MYVFKQRLKDCSIQEWRSDINESPKALQYRKSKLILETETYHMIDLPYI